MTVHILKYNDKTLNLFRLLKNQRKKEIKEKHSELFGKLNNNNVLVNDTISLTFPYIDI